MSCFNNGPETYISVHYVICGMLMQDPYRVVMTDKISKQKFIKTYLFQILLGIWWRAHLVIRAFASLQTRS
jgi:hypothetical protein